MNIVLWSLSCDIIIISDTLDFGLFQQRDKLDYMRRRKSMSEDVLFRSEREKTTLEVFKRVS